MTHKKLACWLALVLAFGVGRVAFAHSMYQSALLLDLHAHSVEARLELPPTRLCQVFGSPFGSNTLDALRPELEQYILQRMHAGSNGKAWAVAFAKPLRWRVVDGSAYVVADLEMDAPTGLTARQFTLQDHVIADSLTSHVVLVSVRSDWNSSTFASEPDLLGVLNGEQRSIDIDRTSGSWTKGFKSVFHLGTRHIAEGTDHLLFLLALLLPAPLLRQGTRWGKCASVHRGFLQILKVVTAFTVGHSITLALAAFGLVHVPARPIEVLIAVSILVSALHAMRPIFPGKEPLIAGSFGLIHGLAFASTLAELGLHRWERVESILAFNLGIEAMQLLVVVCVMPSLMLLSRTRFYRPLRIVGASLAGLAAGGWILERSLRCDLHVDRAVNALAFHPIACATALFLCSLVCFVYPRTLPLQCRRKRTICALVAVSGLLLGLVPFASPSTIAAHLGGGSLVVRTAEVAPAELLRDSGFRCVC